MLRKNSLLLLVLTSLVLPGPAWGQGSIPESPAVLMPTEKDRTSMWWRDGFPGIVEGAPWLRCIETGNFGFAFNTETLEIPHLGENLKSPGAKLNLRVIHKGKVYHARKAEPWSRFAGPRLIESGRFFQRADVTGIEFSDDQGEVFNIEARLETAAWTDRLAMILSARPGVKPIEAGEKSFGRLKGGFGLDGTNFFEIPPDPELDGGAFTLEFRVFVPTDFQVTRVSPWLFCKNRNEVVDGNVGMVIRHDGQPQVRMNIGGGPDNAITLPANDGQTFRLEEWNHILISYDEKTLRFYLNGQVAGTKEIGKSRLPKPGAIAFGGRQDRHGDGYKFRGVIDEIRYYNRALNDKEVRLLYHRPEAENPALVPVREWPFREDGQPSMTRVREELSDISLQMDLVGEKGNLSSRWTLPEGESWSGDEAKTVSIALDPVTFQKSNASDDVVVKPTEFATGVERPAIFDPVLGWHRINLDGIEPIPPAGSKNPDNNAIERVTLSLSNPSGEEKTARLMFEKTARGFRQKIGTPITGISAILRDREGNPTGIPVQLSKNWHVHPEGGDHSGQWFHGISQVRLPAESKVELELVIAYGHWGGLPAASHAQLSLIGWGGNQRWDQSALGSWGESICYEPEQVQANCVVTDVRPLMVSSMGKNREWGWTSNVGGGDFFRVFDLNKKRVPHASMKAEYLRQGPCFTEVIYEGRVGETGINHRTGVSLFRSDDLVRGTYRIRMDVTKPVDFSRLVIFQIGADTYSSTGEQKMAIGNESGLIKEWKTQWGGNVYRTEPHECEGNAVWASLHEAVRRPEAKPGAWANRGMVIREWKARLGGKTARPWMAERGLDVNKRNTSSTLDLVPPPGVTRLMEGDFVEATMEHIIVPQFAEDYYGPNRELRAALEKDANTWRMIHREATGNERKIEMKTGTLERVFPDVCVSTEDDIAELVVTGGHSHVAFTFQNLSSPSGYVVLIDGVPVDQSVHGKDFWQTDYSPASKTWSQTLNLPFAEPRTRTVRFAPIQEGKADD